MSPPLFPWIDALRQEWATADACQRMLLAGRLYHCGEMSVWQQGGYAQHPQQTEAWLLTAADAAGSALVDAHAQDGQALAQALCAIQDVIAAAGAMADAGWQAQGELAIALESCQEAADEAVLDETAVAAIHDWPWRRLLAPDIQLPMIAEPFTLQDAQASITLHLQRAQSPANAASAVAGHSEADKQDCGEWVGAIRDTEGESLRHHFKEAWRWTIHDQPLFQLTWILQDPRRTAEEHIYALQALARYGHPFGWHIIAYNCRRAQQHDAEIRLQACLAMCWTGRLAETVLPQVINDHGEDRPVRLAAARALLMLRDDSAAQEIVEHAGDTDREDRRLHAVAAVARGDGDRLARLSLDGFGAPELPRWGLTALGKQSTPAHTQLVQDLLQPSPAGTITLLGLPVWAVQDGPALARAAQEAARIVCQGQHSPSGLLLRAAACLHDLGQEVWDMLGSCTKVHNRAKIAVGLLGSTPDRLDSQLRHEQGSKVLIAAIADSQRSFKERDHTLSLLILHCRLHPHAHLDRSALVSALHTCYDDAHQAMQAGDHTAKQVIHRISWVSGTLELEDCVALAEGQLSHNAWAAWSLSKMPVPAAHDALRRYAQECIAADRQAPPQLVWALADTRIDVGPELLKPEMVRNPGFWYYAMVTDNRQQEERLAQASSDIVLAYQVFLGRGEREPASLESLQRAWRHLQAVGRWDLTIDLIPELYQHSPDIAWDRVAELSTVLTGNAVAQAGEHLRRALNRARDPQLCTMLHGLAAMLGQPQVELPQALAQLLRNEEATHLRFAGQQLHTDDGKVRGSGVIELAKTFEVACRHHVATRLQGPLYDIAQQYRFDSSPLRSQFRQGLQDAAMGDIEPHCYEGRLEEVIRDSRKGVLGRKPTGTNMSLGYWATALALVHQPQNSSPAVREALRSMWGLQVKRNELAHNLHEVEKPDADATWAAGITSMPVVLQPSSS